MLGELTQSKRELQDAMALYDPEQHAPLALVFAHDFKATAQVYLGVVTALSGDAEAGIAHARAALTSQRICAMRTASATFFHFLPAPMSSPAIHRLQFR